MLHLEHCHVIQNGSDPEIFRPDVPSPPNWRHDPDRLQVAFSAAGVNTYHDMELVQKLASEIDRRQLPIVLHLFGRCVELVASPSPDSMRLHGPVLFKDLPAYLANVDVGLTLYNEHAHFNSPLKMFDYLAAGCIPVCSESSAIRDVLDGTGVGFVADWTAESLANQLLEIQRDGPQRETMQQAGRALIEREYSWRRIAEKTEVILADCLRRRQ